MIKSSRKKSVSTAQKTIIQAGGRMARAAKAKAIFIYLDAVDRLDAVDPLPKGCKLILVTQKHQDEINATRIKEVQKQNPHIVVLPKITMTRLSRIKIAVMLALSKEIISMGDKIVFINGMPDSATLDSILLLDTEKESELLLAHGMTSLSDAVKPEVFQEALNFAIELASRGREGKPIGTIFVLGDEEHVLQYSRQMVINPFKGYDRDECNIMNPTLKETLREFSAIDGAFVISHDGYILSAGRYLGAASDEDSIPRGLGSRHIASAGITALTDAVAIAISESTGDVRIFKNGKIFMEIEKASPTPPKIPVM
jgi:diadenylate cyclase